MTAGVKNRKNMFQSTINRFSMRATQLNDVARTSS